MCIFGSRCIVWVDVLWIDFRGLSIVEDGILWLGKVYFVTTSFCIILWGNWLYLVHCGIFRFSVVSNLVAWFRTQWVGVTGFCTVDRVRASDIIPVWFVTFYVVVVVLAVLNIRECDVTLVWMEDRGMLWICILLCALGCDIALFGIWVCTYWELADIYCGDGVSEGPDRTRFISWWRRLLEESHSPEQRRRIIIEMRMYFSFFGW